MKRAIETTRNRATSMAAAILALGAGAALLGASCHYGQCRGPGCPQPLTGTCPWHCAEPVWDGTSYSVDGFRNSAVFAVWVGRPRDAPSCESSNYFPSRDYYQEPKSIDRCPRCVADEHCTEPMPSTDTWGSGQCYDLPPGASPRSVSATYTLESIAECEPKGGEQSGELRPVGSVSYCCRPPA
ncbi:hypothetical protein [Sorangium sp. So ce406]|uniref:hypothetical protein n=1 Tax=Sorangium sp. So ce406 TaxID=3133311 RepID=UPI003F5C83D2